MARQKKKAMMVRPAMSFEALLLQTVFSEHGLKIAGGFTPKNFAANKMMVELAVRNKLLIEGMVFRTIDLGSYAQSRFANNIRISRIEWPAGLDPSVCRCERILCRCDEGEVCEHKVCEHKVAGSESTKGELMVQIFKDNVEHLKNLCVYLSLDTDVSEEAKEQGFLSQTASDFIETLPQCLGLETLCVIDVHCAQRHATQGSLQVKVMEIMKELPKLCGLEWNGNMTEDMWHAADEGEVGVRCNLFDYLPESLKSLVISEGEQPRMLAWDCHNGIASGLKAVMGNQDKTSKLEALLLPKSFWCLNLGYFKSFMQHLNAGDIQEIGVSDEFQMNERPIARVMVRPCLRSWELPPPGGRLDRLVRSLRRGMDVDLGVCKDAGERAVRLAWVKTLTTGDDAFDTCECDEGEGFNFFTLSKTYTGPDEARRGSEFEVVMRV